MINKIERSVYDVDEYKLDHFHHSTKILPLIYLIGKSKNNRLYTVYSFNQNTNELNPLVYYGTAQEAIDALDRYNYNMNPKNMKASISEMSRCFIKDEMDIHELILGLFNLYKYSDTWEMKHLLRVYDLYYNSKARREMKYPSFTQWNLFIHYLSANPLLHIYNALYDLISIRHGLLSNPEYYDVDSEIFGVFVKEIDKIFK